MKHLLWSATFALWIVSVQAATASTPVVEGEISGVEVCIQDLCEAAVFTGTSDCVDTDHSARKLFRESERRGDHQQR